MDPTDSKPSCVALIPARSGSKRVPDKNIKLLAGHPLIAYSISAALQSAVFAAVIVSTDSERYAEVARHYDLIDVLVYPRLRMRLTETVTPLKPLEAMARRRLIVASDVGGHRELIRDRENGRLFSAGSLDALAETVIDLLGSPQTWETLRSRGRQFVETERSWPASVARYAPVYSALGPAPSISRHAQERSA